MEPETSRPPRQLRPPEGQDVSDSTISPEDSERTERIEYLRSITPAKKPKRRGWIIALIVVIVLAMVGGVYYWTQVRKPATTQSSSQSASHAASQQTVPDATQPIKTKHYDSTNFSLGFDYPDTWTVTDDGSGKLTVKSPVMQLANANGQKATTQVVVTMQPKQANLDAFKKGNAVAVLDSEKISYTAPTPSQRAQTYLSFLNYASSTATGLDGIYVTGDFGYQKDQAIPLVDISKADPLITVTFFTCANSSCSGTATPATLATTNWSDTTYLGKAVKTLLASLTVQ